MTRVAPAFVAGTRQNQTITAAAGAYALNAVAGIDTDDMIVLVGVFININQTVPNLGGWTQLYLQNVNTRCWGVWYRRRLAGDAATYSTPSVANTLGGNVEFQQSAWRGVDWGQPVVSGTTANRATSSTPIDAPSITLVAGSLALAVFVEASNAIENDGSETFTAGWTKAVGYANQTTAAVSIEHALILFKAMAADGATAVSTSTWANASLNGSGVQIGLVGLDVTPPPPVGSSVSPLDATGVRLWDAVSGSWISPSRGVRGAAGPAGPTGPAGSTLVRSMAHRRLSPGIQLPDSWYDFVFDTVPQAQEINPFVSNWGASYWRFARTGAYLVCTNTSYAAGMPAAQLWITALNRYAYDGGSWEVARSGQGADGSASSLTAVVLAHVTDVWKLTHYKTSTGSALGHTSTVTIAYLGPCRVREYDWAVLLDHADITYGLSRTDVYTIAPNVGSTLPGDWVYLVHLHWLEGSSIAPAPPQGFEVVVPLQTARTPGGNGIEWGIWRKKYAAGDSYVVTMPGQRYTHASLVSVRQPTDAPPVLSALVAPRQGVASSAITVPGGEVGSTALAIAVTDTGATNLTPPPSVSAPGVYGWSVPPGGSRTQLATATLGPNLANSNPITFSWGGSVPDVGWIGGVTLSWLPVAL
ncbi:MAG TPA: hypothetical protein VIT65_05070 [Microlunatus sp.]